MKNEDLYSEGVYVRKLFVIGAEGVGKTRISEKYAEKSEKSDYNPRITNHVAKFPIGDETTKFYIVDVGGPPDSNPFKQGPYRGSHAGLLVFDITDYSSFQLFEDEHLLKILRINDWIKQCIIVGNKKDLEDQRKVTAEEGIELAKKLNCVGYVETSAKDEYNIRELYDFLTLIVSYYDFIPATSFENVESAADQIKGEKYIHIER